MKGFLSRNGGDSCRTQKINHSQLFRVGRARTCAHTTRTPCSASQLCLFEEIPQPLHRTSTGRAVRTWEGMVLSVNTQVL